MKFRRGLVNPTAPVPFVMWWNPKAGCTSLKCWFFKTLGMPVHVDMTLHAWCVGDKTVHGLSGDQQYWYSPDEHRDLWQFGVFRNPASRLTSHFRQQAKEGNLETFRQFVAKVCELSEEELRAGDTDLAHHVSFQACAVEDFTRLDSILHVESLAFSWPRLMTFLRRPCIWTLPARNTQLLTDPEPCAADVPAETLEVEQRFPPWWCYYDGPLRRAVAARYAEDFRLLGYSDKILPD